MNLRFQISDSRSRRSGFTFLEVLFAVIVLGIGFIMVAAMFPAAIKQTQATIEDSASNAVALDLQRKLIELAKDPVVPTPAAGAWPRYLGQPTVMPATNTAANKLAKKYPTVAFCGNKAAWWTYVSGNLINDADPRYACVPFYMRDWDLTPTATSTTGQPSAFAQLILIPVHARNSSEYTSLNLNDFTFVPTLFNGVQVKGGAAPTIVIGSAVEDGPVGSGAYLIVSNCATNSAKNGQVYRLGGRVSPTDPTRYYIAPDPQGAADVYSGASYTTDAYIVGRGLTGGSTPKYDGPVQDMGVVMAPIKL